MANWYVSTTGSDSNAGTSTGAPFLTIGHAMGAASSGDRIYIKSGTYTLTATITAGTGTLFLEGYQTTPGDLGTLPLVTTATDSTVLFAPNATVSYINLSFSNTASVRAIGVYAAAANLTVS